MTGVLLIAIAAGLQVLHQLFGLWTMSLLYTRGVSAAATMGVYGAVRGAGSLVAEVLFIVGVALVLRRLPAAPR
jgi:hypothetical protein